MKKFLPLWPFVLLLLSMFACKTATRVLYDPTSTPVPTLTPTSTPTEIPPTATITPTPDACPNGDCITPCLDSIQSIVQTGAGGGESHNGLRRQSAEADVRLVTYPIRDETLGDPIYGSGVPDGMRPLQKNRKAHEQIWNYFKDIIPADQRSFLADFIIFTDGEQNVLAAVSQSENSPQQWVLYVDINDAADPKDLTYTLVHEFGHLVTLNPKQVIPSQAIFDNPNDDKIYQQEADKCSNYFPGEGCSQPDSYINHFVDQFWGDLFDEWDKLNSINNPKDYYNQLEAFYKKYQDQFVTDYAPTSPEEDIAETFSYFILQPRPTADSIADQKILFFYDYPELVQLRSKMGRNLCAQLEK